MAVDCHGGRATEIVGAMCFEKLHAHRDLYMIAYGL